jgi:hypothetical protein
MTEIDCIRKGETMSNIQPGRVLRSEGDDFRLVYHEDGPLEGHIVGWNRQYFDVPDPMSEPCRTNTWSSVDFGNPQEAARVWGWIPDELGPSVCGGG